MELSARYDITVNSNSPAVARAGFGVPLIAGYISTSIIPASERTRSYTAATALASMVTDGFATTDPVYLAAAAALSQSPRPNSIKVGRMVDAFTQGVELTPLTYATGELITVTVSKDGTTRSYSVTATGSDLNTEAAALASAMNTDASGWGSAGSGDLTIAVSGAGAGDIVEIDDASGGNALWYFSGLNNLDLEDVTADRGIADELTAIENYDPDWYGLILADAFGAAEILLAAAWVETREKLLFAQTQDYDNLTDGDGIIYDLQQLSRARTAVIYSSHSMAEYPAAAYAGRFLPEEPGEVVWSDKSLSGVTPSTLTTAQREAVEENASDIRYGNHYTTTASLGNVFPGVVTSGAYIDEKRLADFLVARIREDLFSAARANRKIPFTDAGVALVKGIVLDRLESKVPLALADGSLTFDAPRVADVDAADKAVRKLPGVVIGAQYAGAILVFEMELNLSF